MYIKNSPIGDIVSNDNSLFINNLIADYVIYQKYSTMNNFKSLFSEFINSNLITKFKIIKFLLLSSSPSDAGLLFGLTKEAKTGSNIVADIIHKNLNLPLQLKLHKANISIKTEIEKLNNLDSDDIDLKKQVMVNKNMPPKVKKLALEKINEMKSGNSEYYKQLLYVKTLIDFPWTGDNDGDIFTLHKNDRTKWKDIMESTSHTLHTKVYGHTECKNTIIELLGKWFSNPKSLGKAVGLWGPPGVGKTLIAKELGDALGIPCTKINLGGMEDGAVLSGHSITYSGAVPGLIVKRMVEAGKPRCIMFFDELDKACYHHGRNEIYDILIHVIDSTTNAEFNDKFFQDVSFPINKVLFMFSFNDRSKIDPILLDRMEIIKVDAYTTEDKINIVKNFLVKELQSDVGLNDLNIELSDENIIYLVDSFTQEPGVRSIRRKIEKILLKLNKDKIFGAGPFENNKDVKDIVISKELIDKYLVKPSIQIKRIGDVPEIGVVNGLFATTLGDGGIIPILIYRNQMGNDGKFCLKLTGKQGKVMKESVEIAWTLASNLVDSKYLNIFFNNAKSGLHIHTPDGATDKDGPSAGSAFLLAFFSIILGKCVKNNIGITGELERSGSITAIGGLEYKLPGAKKAGINLVFVPKENQKDIEKIKEYNKSLFDDNFRYILVDNIRDVLDLALIESCTYESSFVYNELFKSSKYIHNKINIVKNINNRKNKKNKLTNIDHSDTPKSDTTIVEESSSYSSDRSK
jgi:endopeptidase La